MTDWTTSEPKLLGNLTASDLAPIPGATRYTATEAGDGLAFKVPAGALAGAKWLTFDILVEADFLTIFEMNLKTNDGKLFGLTFGALDFCQARLRLPLVALKQNRWGFPREGALLKPLCFGDRIEIEEVEEIAVKVLRKAEQPINFSITSISLSSDEPAKIDGPILLRGLILDKLGQNSLRDWPGKTRSEEELVGRLERQLADAPNHRWPETFSRWGGLKEVQWKSTGFFRTHHDGRRWWLVDPDGHPFWSAGMDCVAVNVGGVVSGIESAIEWLPEEDGPFAAAVDRGDRQQTMVNYLAANLIRAFGPDEWHVKWSQIALGELRRLGFNTVANWSDWKIARATGFPYVVPLDVTFPRSKTVFRELPDVFHPDFDLDAADYAEQLREFEGDPGLIGYFLMNEPSWGFTLETPAAGMLATTPSCASRKALAEFLLDRYGDERAFQAAWGLSIPLSTVAEGEWRYPLNEAALTDLERFSTILVERFFGTLSRACKAVDTDHLNLGMRYYTVPPDWVMAAMQGLFDVFSMNCYQQRVPPEQVAAIAQGLGIPVMVGEWHFGALDVGLPGSGIGRVADQEARGTGYRCYVETAAALPDCVGVHYFTMYDESAIGRFDGENWNIGFFDTCSRPYAPICEAAIATHERLYRVATGEEPPFEEWPEYLPRVFN